jgi:DNA-binding LacI/PurR family transcriptional regulator
MPFAASFAVPLTTLAVPVERMVRRVAKLVAGSSPARKRHRFKLDLVERSSHGPAPKRRSK